MNDPDPDVTTETALSVPEGHATPACRCGCGAQVPGWSTEGHARGFRRGVTRITNPSHGECWSCGQALDQYHACPNCDPSDDQDDEQDDPECTRCGSQWCAGCDQDQDDPEELLAELCPHGMSTSLCEGPGHYAPDTPDTHLAPAATMAEAHAEWHRNTGVPIGTPGCPQDACHDDDQDEPDTGAQVPTILVVLIPADPHQPAALTRIPRTLDGMQEAIGGGWLEAIHTMTGTSVIWVDDEGKLKHQPINARASDLARALVSPSWYDPLAGDVLVTGCHGPETNCIDPWTLDVVRGYLLTRGETMTGDTL